MILRGFHLQSLMAFAVLLSAVSLNAQTIIGGSKPSTKPAPAKEVYADYTHLYPKSTPAEYKRAADKARISCIRFRASVIRINPQEAGPQETPEKTCDCYYRNIAKAKDIHELHVVDSYFRGVEQPPSVFADDEEIGDVFDERPDYITHANNVLQSCKANSSHVEPSSTSQQKAPMKSDKTNESKSKAEKTDGAL